MAKKKKKQEIVAIKVDTKTRIRVEDEFNIIVEVLTDGKQKEWVQFAYFAKLESAFKYILQQKLFELAKTGVQLEDLESKIKAAEKNVCSKVKKFFDKYKEQKNV